MSRSETPSGTASRKPGAKPDLDAAARMYLDAVEANPEDAESWHQLGLALFRSGRAEEAREPVERSVALRPGNSSWLSNLGMVRRAAGATDDADQAFREALAADPENGTVLTKLVESAREACRFEEAAETGARLDQVTRRELRAGKLPAESPMLSLLRTPDPDQNLRIARAWARSLPQAAKKGMPNLARPAADGPLRMGFLVQDLVDPLVRRSLGALLEHHDKDKLRPSLYAAASPSQRGERGKLGSKAYQLVPIDGLDDTAVASRVRTDGVELLVDLTGHGARNRLGALALRSAAVQVHWLGFPGSIGGAFLDGLIADPAQVPDPDRRWIHEVVVRPTGGLHGLIARPAPEPASSRKELGLPEAATVFACIGLGQELDPETFASWCEILAAVERSVLWIQTRDPRALAELARRAEARGIRPDRLVPFQAKPGLDAAAVLGHADLVLDVAATNVRGLAHDALGAGVPVLAVKGNRMASRLSSALLGCLELDDLAVPDLAAYRDRAIELGRHPKALKKLGARIQKLSEKHPAFDPAALARTFEATIMDAKLRLQDPRRFPAWPEAVKLAAAGTYLEAAQAYEAMSKEFPYSVFPLTERGGLLKTIGHYDDAAAALDKALEIRPSYAHALGIRYETARSCLDWDVSERIHPDLMLASEDAIHNDEPTPESSMFSAILHRDMERQLESYRSRVRKMVAKVEPTPMEAFAERKAKTGRLVIGYLTDDFRNHAIAHLAHALIPEHDRESFQVNVYLYGKNDRSIYRERVETWADRSVDISEMSHGEAARVIREHGVDILVELKGWTAGQKFDVMAHRPAPIMVSWLGFPGTTGADFIDYVITDPNVVPPEHERFLSEKPVIMPWCYQVNDHAQEIATVPHTRKQHGLPEDGLVFACMSQPYKIDVELFRFWMELLAENPGSVLWAYARQTEIRRNLRVHAERAGIDPDRILFAGNIPKQHHLARMRLADIALDTLDYNGHTTVSDFFWAGVPVVTMLGPTFPTRVAASLARTLGMGELVAQDWDGYRQLARALARDPERRAELRRRLEAARFRSPLYDTARFARNLEKAYRTMWERFRSGAPVERLEVVEDPGMAVGPVLRRTGRRLRAEPGAGPKKVVFSMSTGRSGTQFLAEVLRSNLPGSRVQHEYLAPHDFGVESPDIGVMRRFQAYGDMREVRAFWAQKLNRVFHCPAPYYVETSHALMKGGLIENILAWEDHPEVHLVTLERDIRKTALSMLHRAEMQNSGNVWLWYIDAKRGRSIVDYSPFEPFHQTGTTVWYILEVRARAAYYQAMVEGHPRIKVHRIDLDELAKPKGVIRLIRGIEGNIPKEIVMPPPKNENPKGLTLSKEEMNSLDRVLGTMRGDPAQLGREWYEAGRRL